jgi:Uncharacterized protein conserved in bacteria C-term(DUF2220)
MAEGATALAGAISAAVTAHRTRKVPLEVVMAAAARVDHSASVSVGWRKRVCETIDELVATGAIEVPKTKLDRSGDPPLPLYLLRPSVSAKERVAPRRIVWHADLAWVAHDEDAGNLGAGDRQFLEPINRWLSARRGVVVPMRERSLEIFGDEKLLERRVLGPLFAPGRLSFDLLECEPCWPPVHQEVLGDGPWLIVENYTTYVSLARCAARSGFAGRVVWGSGNQVGTRIDALALAEERPEALWYFGDLDAGGARVARMAQERCTDAGFVPLEPVRALYALALEHGRPAAKRSTQGSADLALWASQWVGGDIGARFSALVRSGQRIVQEAVGTELLADRTLGALLGASARPGGAGPALRLTPPTTRRA